MTIEQFYTSFRILFRSLLAAPVGNIIFYFSQFVNALVLLATRVYVDTHDTEGILGAALYLFFTSIPLYIAGTLPISPIQPSRTVSPPHAVPSSDYSSPEDSVSFWNWISMTFPSLYYPVSGKHRLELTDVWILSPRFLHANLFRKYLSSQAELEQKKKREPLIWFLIKANSRDIILDITIELYKSVAGFIPPYALKQLLAILSSTEKSDNESGLWGNKWVRAHFWALVTLVAHLSFAQCDLAQGWFTRRCYERTRGVIFCALHWKALRRRVVGGASSAENKQKGEKDKKDANSKEETPIDELEEERSADLGKVVNLMQ
jgi:hypothetical protein